jgi:hypothetical protein
MVFADNGERTVAYIRKPRKGEKSEAEQRRDDNWAEARAYASSVKARNPALWELYSQVGKERKISPFALAIGDYLKLPTFKPLDLKDYKGQVGDPIQFHGKDDMGLVSVGESLSNTQHSTDTRIWTHRSKTPLTIRPRETYALVGMVSLTGSRF